MTAAVSQYNFNLVNYLDVSLLTDHRATRRVPGIYSPRHMQHRGWRVTYWTLLSMSPISTGFRQQTYLPVSSFSAVWFTGWQTFLEHWEMWYLCFWRAEMTSTVVHLNITCSKKSVALRCTQHLSLDREHWPGLSDPSVTLGWCYHMSVYFCGSSWCSCEGPQPCLPTQPDRVNSHWLMKVYRQLRSRSLSSVLLRLLAHSLMHGWYESPYLHTIRGSKLCSSLWTC